MQLQRILKNLELIFLSLMIVTLPSLEAPKNIFLVFYVTTSLIRQLSNPQRPSWSSWDSIFLLILGTALLSTIFAGMPQHEEWKGFRVLVTMISTGWLVSRGEYTSSELSLLFKIIVLGIIPPLAWGLWQLFVTHAKTDLQIHSVGHVNHSAIYLTMVFGASLGWLLFLERDTSTIKRVALTILSALLFTCLIIGESRGAVGIGFVLDLLIICLLSKNTLTRSIGLASSALVLIAAVTLNVGVIQKQKTMEDSHNVLSNRDKVWNVSLEAARFSPALGLGMSNWHFITLDQLKASVERRGKTFDPDNYQIQWGHSHSLYLTALVDRGFIGLSVTLMFMFAWIRHLIKTFRLTKSNPQAAYLWAGALSAWVATFGIGLVNTTFHHEHGILACLLLGLYLCYTRSEESKSLAKQP